MELSMGMSADYEQAVGKFKNIMNFEFVYFIRFWKDQQTLGLGRKFSGKGAIKNNSQNNNFFD